MRAPCGHDHNPFLVAALCRFGGCWPSADPLYRHFRYHRQNAPAIRLRLGRLAQHNCGSGTGCNGCGDYRGSTPCSAPGFRAWRAREAKRKEVATEATTEPFAVQRPRIAPGFSSQQSAKDPPIRCIKYKGRRNLRNPKAAQGRNQKGLVTAHGSRMWRRKTL